MDKTKISIYPVYFAQRVLFYAEIFRLARQNRADKSGK